MPKVRIASKKIFSAAAASLLALCCNAFRCMTANAQTVGAFDEMTAQNIVWEGRLRDQVEFYCDSLLGGRATGTVGASETAFSLIRRFRNAGLLPLSGTHVRSFPAKDSTLAGHNVLGMLPGSVKSPVESYVIVAAHFDGLGTLNGTMYPGADSNASGTVALTSIADMFSAMKVFGRSYGSSIIFVGLDGGTLSMAGAYALWDDIENGRLQDPLTGRHITPEKVRLMVNIDQIGSSLSPLKSGREDFIIMLGNGTVRSDCRRLFSICNNVYGIDMELSETYYGSENFTRLFYRLSDQRPFVDNGIPAVMFTSGITMNNNKPLDLPDTLNYPVLKRRIYLIYHWLDRICFYL